MNIRSRGALISIILIIAAEIVLLSGCTRKARIFRDRSNDYCSVRACPYIHVPECLHPEPFSKEYQIP